ncbi:MAG: nucleotidyl transferase AbiEii/AbiGii toxin family protein [Candidatus Paceibacterota bacterium]|jgi:hypothetical protein
MVIDDEIKKYNNQLRFDILPRPTVEAFKKCAEVNLFSSGKWYLAGGTALALQTGHRQSVDLDFFTEEKNFDEKKTEKSLSDQGRWVTTSLDRGTIYGEFLGAKISLIAYPFFAPAVPMREYGNIRMAAPLDIAVMKVIAISQRGKKRDFFDLYWICQHISPLSEIIPLVHKQYVIGQNPTHILKSMMYFEDAEDDPEPLIFFKANWKEVKDFFKKEIPIITKKLIKLE